MSTEAARIFSLSGETALLTGVSGFLGRRMGEALLENGARLVALGRSPAKMKSLEDEWRPRYGERFIPHSVNMYDLDALNESVDRILDQTGGVDVLVNNAHEMNPRTGFNTADGSVERASYDQWMRNLTGGIYWPALLAQRVGPGMKERGRGAIVNISTMYAVVAPSPLLYEGVDFLNPPGYSAAKAGMLAFTRYLASFWGPWGIRANAILPGPFSNTEDEGPNSVGEEDPFLDRLRVRTCLRRVGRPDELLGALLFLASDASSYVTGQAIVVDGGWTVT